MMVKLAIIADDITGSLDTGIKFAKEGIATQIFLHSKLSFDAIEKDTEVIVIDTETRHLAARKAGGIVGKTVSACMEYGIRNFYKKTDSALRGHIGSELTSLTRRTGKKLYFIPALPQENRYTKNGIHYIRGIPVGHSIFSKDPFNPVKYNSVSRIIREEAEIWTGELGENLTERSAPGTEIVIVDARTEDDLRRIADYLEEKDALSVTAGCAGFAPWLAKKMNFRKKDVQIPEGCSKLIVLSGSINKVTGRQLAAAEKEGFFRRTLSPAEKLIPAYLTTPEGQGLLEEIDKACDQEKRVIIDVFSPGADGETMKQAEGCGIGRDDIPRLIADRLGELFLHLSDRYPDAAIMLIGGDTLYASAMKCPGIVLEPVYEPVNGTVFVRGLCGDRKLSLLSKSGGFGEKDLLIELSNHILAKEKLEVTE